MSQTRKPAKRSPARFGWLGWIAGIALLLPIALVLTYRYVNPPVTLQMIMNSDKPVERTWEPLSRLSQNLVDAAIAAEDANFCTHHGFDEAAIRAAWTSNEEGKGLRGASTISMQTAKNAFLWPDRTWLRKALEAYFTVLTEAFWPKRRIMEVYLNIAQWGTGLYGAEAASQHYFHKDAAHLTIGEASRLVAVLPDPLKWSPVAMSYGLFYHSQKIEERATIVRVDGKSRCVLPQQSATAKPRT